MNEERLEYTDIIVEKKYPIGYITINRPEKRNALRVTADGTVRQLQQAGIDMREDSQIRVFVIKGTGDCFCAGFDMGTYDGGMFKEQESLPEHLKWVENIVDEPWTRYVRRFGDLSNPEGVSLAVRDMFEEALWNNPKPAIAQVDSFCLGAGLWIINNCDVVYATPEAIFAYPPIRYGASITPAILPPWLLGRRQVMDMALTGKSITAAEAYNCGLITKIIPREEIEDEVRKEAESIAKVPPVTNMFSKMAINSYYEALPKKEFSRIAMAYVLMTENSDVPGHYFDFFRNRVFKKGFTEAYKDQRAKWGYPDPVLDREVARLRAQKERK